jgi:sigma-B regulation protein RsbU (phosphoserine phosphatase)
LLYTDGVSEARDLYGTEYGEARLTDLLRTQHELPAADLIKKLVTEVHSFTAAPHATDDLTLMAIEMVGH